jgi:hypothetical protein
VRLRRDSSRERRQVQPLLLLTPVTRYRSPGPPQSEPERTAYLAGVEDRAKKFEDVDRGHMAWATMRERRAYMAGLQSPPDESLLAAPLAWRVQLPLLLLDAVARAAPEHAKGFVPKLREGAPYLALGLMQFRVSKRLEHRRALELGLTPTTIPRSSSSAMVDGLLATLLWQTYRLLRGWKLAHLTWTRALAQRLIAEMTRRHSWRAAGGPI